MGSAGGRERLARPPQKRTTGVNTLLCPSASSVNHALRRLGLISSCLLMSGVRKLAECDGPATFVSGQAGVQALESVGSLAAGAMYPLGVAPPAPTKPCVGHQQQQLQHQMKGEGESEAAISKHANEDIVPPPVIAEHAVSETETASSEAELERQRETDAHLSKAANAAAAAATGQNERKGRDSSLLVVGGTGRLGQAVINRVLEQQRYGRVRVLVRPGSNAAEGGLQAAFPQAVRSRAVFAKRSRMC